jgi:hypothetical protein
MKNVPRYDGEKEKDSSCLLIEDEEDHASSSDFYRFPPTNY